jgi:hypothetical protein
VQYQRKVRGAEGLSSCEDRHRAAYLPYVDVFQVLGRFRKDEEDAKSAAVRDAVEIIEAICALGMEIAVWQAVIARRSAVRKNMTCMSSNL